MKKKKRNRYKNNLCLVDKKVWAEWTELASRADSIATILDGHSEHDAHVWKRKKNISNLRVLLI